MCCEAERKFESKGRASPVKLGFKHTGNGWLQVVQPLLLHPNIALERISERPKSKIFLGEHAPRPPYLERNALNLGLYNPPILACPIQKCFLRPCMYTHSHSFTHTIIHIPSLSLSLSSHTHTHTCISVCEFTIPTSALTSGLLLLVNSCCSALIQNTLKTAVIS